MNVKTCIVRSMCRPTEAFLAAQEALCLRYPEFREDIIKGKSENAEILSGLRQLPAQVE